MLNFGYRVEIANSHWHTKYIDWGQAVANGPWGTGSPIAFRHKVAVEASLLFSLSALKTAKHFPSWPKSTAMSRGKGNFESAYVSNALWVATVTWVCLSNGGESKFLHKLWRHLTDCKGSLWFVCAWLLHAHWTAESRHWFALEIYLWMNPSPAHLDECHASPNGQISVVLSRGWGGKTSILLPWRLQINCTLQLLAFHSQWAGCHCLRHQGRGRGPGDGGGEGGVTSALIGRRC